MNTNRRTPPSRSTRPLPSRGSRSPERDLAAPLPLLAAGPAPSPSDREAERAPRRVLLGDGDAVRRGLLRDLLQQAGFEVVAFASGFELLGHAQPWIFRGVAIEPPDAIVCGMHLADWSGADVLRILRSGDGDTPFVALVDRDTTGVRSRLLALGADGVACEDVDGARLGALLNTLLRRRDEPSSWSQAA